MTQPPKEWREKFDHKYNQLALWNGLGYGNVHTEIKDFIQTLLENTAVIKGERRRIIEQIREEERAHLVAGYRRGYEQGRFDAEMDMLNVTPPNQEKELESAMKVTDAIAQHGAQRPTHAKEWREQIKKEVVGMEHPEIYRRTCSFIQNLLTTHTAHLVERISELKVKHLIDENGKEYCDLPHEYCDTCEHNQALDQAIDIVKNNK